MVVVFALGGRRETWSGCGTDWRVAQSATGGRSMVDGASVKADQRQKGSTHHANGAHPLRRSLRQGPLDLEPQLVVGPCLGRIQQCESAHPPGTISSPTLTQPTWRNMVRSAALVATELNGPPELHEVSRRRPDRPQCCHRPPSRLVGRSNRVRGDGARSDAAPPGAASTRRPRQILNPHPSLPETSRSVETPMPAMPGWSSE